MRFRKAFGLALFALLALIARPTIGLAGADVIGPSSFTFTAASQSNVWNCNTGQSTFSVTVPSGLSGTFTVTVAHTLGGTYVKPPWAMANGAAAYSNTIVNSGAMTVTLGSYGYVKVADTSYTSGSVVVTGSCSGAVAVVPPQGYAIYAPAPNGTDDTAALQADLALACPVGGGNAAGYVVLGPGTYKVSSTLALQCSNEGIIGQGASNPTLSTAVGSTALSWVGTIGGTMIEIAAPAGTGTSNPYGNLSGDYVTGVQLASGNGISGTGGAAYGILDKGAWNPHLEHLSCDGFSSWCIDLTYDTQFNVAGVSGARIDDVRGESFNGGFLYFDGAYSSTVSNLSVTVNNNTAVKFGGGTTTSDESDTVTVTGSNTGIAGTGIGFDLSCNSSEITIIGGASTVAARGTSTCASRQGPTFGDSVLAQNSTGPYKDDIESGAGVYLTYTTGQTIGYQPTAGTSVDVPAFFYGLTASTPPPTLYGSTSATKVQGEGNSTQTESAISNSNGVGHYTVSGTYPSTCGGVSGTTWSVTDAVATSSPAPEYVPNASACVAIGSDGSIGATGHGGFGGTVTAGTGTAPSAGAPGTLISSNSSTTGKLILGGTSSYCVQTYNGTNDFLTCPLSLTSSTNKGQASCAMSSSSSCAATATILTSSICTATYDTGSTVALADLLPINESVVGTSVTFYAAASANQTGTVYIDFLCL